MTKHKLVFDFDKTLAYRDGMWTATLFGITMENGYTDIDQEDIRKYIKTGFPWDDYEIPHKTLFNKLTWWEYAERYFENIFIKNGIPQGEAKRLSKLVRNSYTNITKWHLYEETYSALLELCNMGYDCYILSNHVPELDDIVEGLNIKPFIKHVYNSAIIGYEKPNSEIFRHLISDLDVHPSNIIMVGDNYISDIVGARSNGINAVLIRSENEYSYPNYAADLSEIPAIAERIENRTKSFTW
jgi:putative hydrolase of the HAD superfamily